MYTTKNQEDSVSSTVNTSTQDLSFDDAQEMMWSWMRNSQARDADVTGDNDALMRGLPVRVGRVIFHYSQVKHPYVLLVSGVVGKDTENIFGKHPDKWDFLVRTGQRDYPAMMYGKAHFELVKPSFQLFYRDFLETREWSRNMTDTEITALYDKEPEMILLTTSFTERISDGQKFGNQVRWLLRDADYWANSHFKEVMTKSEEDLMKESPALNEWMLKNLPKPL